MEEMMSSDLRCPTFTYIVVPSPRVLRVMKCPLRCRSNCGKIYFCAKKANLSPFHNEQRSLARSLPPPARPLAHKSAFSIAIHTANEGRVSRAASFFLPHDERMFFPGVTALHAKLTLCNRKRSRSGKSLVARSSLLKASCMKRDD